MPNGDEQQVKRVDIIDPEGKLAGTPGKVYTIPITQLEKAQALGWQQAPTIGAAKPPSFLEKLEQWYTSAKPYQGTLAEPGRSPQRIGSDIQEGMMAGGVPLIGGALAAAPLATMLGMGEGFALQQVGQKGGAFIGEKVGAPELGKDVGSLLGLAGGAATGIKTAKPVEEYVGKRRIAKGKQEVRKALTAGVKPQFDKSFQRTIDRGYLTMIEKQFNPKDVRGATEAVMGTAKALEEKIVGPAIERHPTDTISGSEVADAMTGTLNQVDKQFFPENIAEVRALANRFRGKPITLATTRELLATFNAMEEGMFSATPEDAAAQKRLDANLEAVASGANKVRQLLYSKLDAVGEYGIADFQKDFGALKDVGTAMNKNIVKAERIGKGPSLMESVLRQHPWLTAGMIAIGAGLESTGHGELGMIAGAIPFMRWVGERRGVPNALMERAFGRFGKAGKVAPTPVPWEPMPGKGREIPRKPKPGKPQIRPGTPPRIGPGAPLTPEQEFEQTLRGRAESGAHKPGAEYTADELSKIFKIPPEYIDPLVAKGVLKRDGRFYHLASETPQESGWAE